MQIIYVPENSHKWINVGINRAIEGILTLLHTEAPIYHRAQIQHRKDIPDNLSHIST